MPSCTKLKTRGLSLYVVLSGMLFAALVTPFVAFAQTGNPGNDPAMKREYFVRQGVDEALLIRLTAYEAEIKSSIFAPERKLLLVSALPRSRIAPLFQFVDAGKKPRQLDIEITSSANTANSKFGIEVTRLAVWDQRSAELAQAYRMLSFGTQQSTVDSAANWTVRINALMSAAGTFDQYGMDELQLWATYLAAHLIQHRLHDYNLVLGITREILNDTRATRWTEVELAAQQLRSAALVGLRGKGDLKTSSTDQDPVQSSLHKSATLAASMGFRYEQAHAINQSGLDYANRSLTPKALAQFQTALEIADSIGDDALAKGIRESIAQIHTGQGDDPATSKVLQEIGTQLAEEGGGDELALNLLQQGRIFIRNYRYPQAIEVLLQALNFQNDSSIRSQVNLELAKAHFETGQREAMQANLEAVGINPWQAPSYFDQSYQAALAGPSGLRHAAETQYLRARSLAGAGRRSEARAVLEELIDQVLFLRQTLPGVLGAWYWERHESLFEDYLSLQEADGAESLLVLSKIRHATRSPVLVVDTDSLRTQLAQRENAERGEASGQTDPGIEQEMAVLRALFNQEFGFLTEAGLQKYINSLGADEAVLTYHFSTEAAYTWVVRNGKVKQQKLANPARLYMDLKDASDRFQRTGTQSFNTLMSTLGEQLLGPVADLLPETVYVIPSGLLLGFPFDALRLDDHYLVERHRVVNLLSFPSNPNPSASVTMDWPQEIFLAGDPQDFYGGYATRMESSAEIQAVTEVFVGPGLHIIQGAALLADEFQADHFKQADLAHFSMPGVIELGYANDSRLQLSEPVRGLGRMSLRPADIQPLRLNASLVYLSATQVRGVPRSNVSYQLGFVSGLLKSGSDSIVAGLWVNQGKSEENLLINFYARLKSAGGIATALTGAKRQYIQEHNNEDLRNWVALQAYIK